MSITSRGGDEAVDRSSTSREEVVRRDEDAAAAAAAAVVVAAAMVATRGADGARDEADELGADTLAPGAAGFFPLASLRRTTPDGTGTVLLWRRRGDSVAPGGRQVRRPGRVVGEEEDDDDDDGDDSVDGDSVDDASG